MWLEQRRASWWLLACSFAESLSTDQLLGELRARTSVLVDRNSPNSMREVTLARGGRLNAIDWAMLEALEDAVENADAVMLTSVDSRAFCAGGDVRSIAAQNDAATDFLAREYTLLEKVRAKSNCVAVCDGIAMGMGFGLVMAAKRRIVTQSATVAMPECRIGLIPDAGALHFLKTNNTSLGLWLALTGMRLNSHDLVGLGLATGFVDRRSDQLSALLEELKHAPIAELDVVLDRRCRDPDSDLASPLLAVESVSHALDRIFDGAPDVAEISTRLSRERQLATRAIGSCAWQTREHGEAVLEVLDAGSEALLDSCPLALETTLLALTDLKADDPLQAHIAELVINANLAARPTFQARVQAKLGSRLTPGKSLPTPAAVDPRPHAARLIAAATDAVDAFGSYAANVDAGLDARLAVLDDVRLAVQRNDFRVPNLPP